MNIIQAKDYIKDAIKIYLKKDEFGDYKIPVERQRPIFLVGAPGIGKTAIMEQIAEELSIALVSYSMTHHTRQSALGLPVISQKIYDGKEYNVTEYTMSEIVSSIYDTISESGIKEGMILVSAMHITAGVYVNDAESGLIYDIEHWLEDIAPANPNYMHHRTGETNGDAHLKSLVIGHEIIVPVTNGKLDFGPWQQIYYAEFDGRRRKRVIVKVMGE